MKSNNYSASPKPTMRKADAGRTVRVAFLFLLSLLALLTRLEIDIPGATDVDTLNFGTAAIRFSVIDSQPHPPGYPGYVLFLKLIHLLFPWHGPLGIAKWGSRLCSMATVWAAYWTVREILGGSPLRTGQGWLEGSRSLARAPVGPALVAATCAVFQPLLWYYGADGQSHAMEALITLVLFGVAARAGRKGGLGPTRNGGLGPGRKGGLGPARNDGLGPTLLVAGLLGLSGAMRPNIPLLCSPLLLWLLWGRSVRDLLVALAVGAGGVLAWYIPLIELAGGWDLYQRLNRALYFDMFIQNFSIFGARATSSNILLNLSTALYALGWSAPFFLMWSRARGGHPSELPGWRKVLLAIVGLNAIFYALTYISESGYVIAVAALSCLVPATWGNESSSLLTRALVAFLLGSGLLLLLPEDLPALGSTTRIETPSIAHMNALEAEQRVYNKLICGTAGKETTLVISDLPVTLLPRLLPWMCSDVLGGMYAGPNPLSPKMDNWLIFGKLSSFSLPTEVPLELGPPTRKTHPKPVDKVMVSPSASTAFLKQVAASATCPPEGGEEQLSSKDWRRAPIIWKSSCLEEIRVGGNVLGIVGKSGRGQGG